MLRRWECHYDHNSKTFKLDNIIDDAYHEALAQVESKVSSLILLSGEGMQKCVNGIQLQTETYAIC